MTGISTQTSTPIAALRDANMILQQATLAPTSLKESELVVLLQAKDAKAFSVLYDHYAPILFAITLKIVPVRSLAEEVLQEAFVKIWRNMHQYDPLQGGLFTWLLPIVRHTAMAMTGQQQGQIDHKRNPALAIDQESDQQPRPAVDQLKPEGLLAELTQEQHLLIEYLYFKGYTQVELAREPAIPLDRVKTRTRTALSQLQKWTTPRIKP